MKTFERKVVHLTHFFGLKDAHSAKNVLAPTKFQILEMSCQESLKSDEFHLETQKARREKRVDETSVGVGAEQNQVMLQTDNWIQN